MRAEEYLKDPCGASSLPFWKTEGLAVPEGLEIVPEEAFRAGQYEGVDEPYFRLIHRMENIGKPELPSGFEPAECRRLDFARHIRECYAEEGVTPEELEAYTQHPVYDPDLWIAVRDQSNGKIAATGIAELDRRIGEGIPEWIQVSPEYRRRGLGQYIVRELLRRMKGRASFATVSGRVNNPDHPMALYLSCGFEHRVIWHVIRKTKG